MTTSSSTGTVTSTGLGSGLDIDTLVSNLVTAQMTAAQSKYDTKKTDIDAKVSSLATLKSALATYQSSLKTLTSGTGFSAISGTSSDEDVFTVDVDDTAAVGSYSVVVSQIAQAHQILSGAFTDVNSTSVGTGTLNISVGSSSFSVAIGSSASTLQDIADAINYDADNSYLSATIINGTNGPQLLLTSLATGDSNNITVSVTNATGNLGDLAYSSSSAGEYTQIAAAQDASISVAGVAYTSDSNTISDVLDGVTLNLQSAAPSSTLTLKISKDITAMQDLIGSFISSYNTLLTSLSSLDSYDATTGEAGEMFGDSLLSGIRRQIRSAMSGVVDSVSGVYNSLSSLGITTDADGYLNINDSKLYAALYSNFSSVSSMFTADDGIVAKVNDSLSLALDSDGTLAARSATLSTETEKNSDLKQWISDRTDLLTARYYQKYNAMDTLLGEMQNTSSYLTQIFDSLNNSKN